MRGAPRSGLRVRCAAGSDRLVGSWCIAPGVGTGDTSALPPYSATKPPHAPHYADAFPGRSASGAARLDSDRHPALAPTAIAPSQQAYFPAAHSGRFLSRDRTGAHVQLHRRPSRRPSHNHYRPRPLVSDDPSAAASAPASAGRSQHPSPEQTRRSSGSTANRHHGWFAWCTRDETRALCPPPAPLPGHPC